MEILRIVFFIVAIMLAWVLLYQKPLIFKLNTFMREHVFSDQLVLFSGGRLALLLVVLGVLSLFSGIDLVTKGQTLKPRIAAKIFAQAQNEYKEAQYQKVIKLCEELLRSDNQNLAVYELLGNAYWVSGQESKARETYAKILEINPGYSFNNAKLKKLFQTKKHG